MSDMQRRARRHFIKTAALAASAATLAAPAVSAAKTNQPLAAVEPTASARGYRKTAHVRRYYELARQL